MATSQTLADVATAYLINAQAREELKDSSERSRELALHDALTGLPNRTLLLELLDHALQRSHRTEKSTAVLFLDLDGFKAVNDTYGHGVGDQLLVAVARRLSHLLRALGHRGPPARRRVRHPLRGPGHRPTRPATS